MTRNILTSLAFLGVLSLAAACQQSVGEESSNMTADCDPTLMCGSAFTCVDGLEYPTTCGPANCDEPIGPCAAEECDPTLMCGEAMTCVDGQWYPTTCGPDNCDEPLGPCPDGTCGGLAGKICGDDEFCHYEVGCGLPDEEGICTVRPDMCPEHIDPVCGCDDQTYTNECSANSMGIDVQHEGECQ